MRKTLSFVLLLLAAARLPLFAEELVGPSIPAASAIVVATADLAPSSRAEVMANSALRDAISRQASRLRLGGTPTQAPQAVGSGSWVARHPVQAGFWIGALSGAVVGAAACANASEFVGMCTVGGFGAGAGAGSYAGVIASAISARRRGQPLSTGTKVGLVAGTAGLIVIGSSTGWTFTW